MCQPMGRAIILAAVSPPPVVVDDDPHVFEPSGFPPPGADTSITTRNKFLSRLKKK